MKLVSRKRLEKKIADSLKEYPVTLLLGPRQCGKTTVAKKVSSSKRATYFDFENPADFIPSQQLLTRLQDLKGLIVIDECQKQPAIFPILRVLADRRPLPATFLLLGSASLDLVKGASESLAGRIGHIYMEGFSIGELGGENLKKLWVRGSFPGSVLASSDQKSHEWRLNFIQSFLERDIPQLGIRIPSSSLRRFWVMMAHLHAQLWNASDLARSMGTQEATARRYLDILSGAFMIRQLPPWYENIGKRLVKAPKIYFRDMGLLHTLLGLSSTQQVEAHPRSGFSWEGFILEEVIRTLEAERDAFFYRTHAGAELDLLINRQGKQLGFEVKYVDAPTLSKSMHIAMEDLKLDKLWVLYPGEREYSLHKKVVAFPASRIPELKTLLNSHK